MEVRILKYTGPIEDGIVIVRQEHVLSKHRNLKVYKGAQWEVGKEIPETTAKSIIDMHGHSFVIETVELDNNGEVLQIIKDFLEGYMHRFGDDAKSAVPALTCEALVVIFGDDAVESILQCLAKSEKITMAKGEILQKLEQLMAEAGEVVASADASVGIAAEAGATLEKAAEAPMVDDGPDTAPDKPEEKEPSDPPGEDKGEAATGPEEKPEKAPKRVPAAKSKPKPKAKAKK